MRLRNDEVVFWLRYRGAGFGDGKQVVSEQLMGRAAEEIEEYREFLSKPKWAQVLQVLGWFPQ